MKLDYVVSLHVDKGRKNGTVHQINHPLHREIYVLKVTFTTIAQRWKRSANIVQTKDETLLTFEYNQM